ncbi:MAG: Fe-S cluster assembly protein SufD [Pseudomonadota bacterium]
MNLSALEQAFDTREAGRAGQREALDALIASGLPTRKSELWKYTKAAPLAEFAIAALTDPAPTADIDAVRARVAARIDALGGAGRLVFIDGALDETLTQLPEGIRVEAASSAAVSATGADDALALINAAMPGADLTLRVASEVAIDGVLHVVHALAAQSSLGQVRLAIELASRASLTVAEHFADDGIGAGMHNTVVSVRLAEDARLHLRRLQALGTDTLQVTRIEAALADHATLDTVTVDAGGKTVRNDLNVRLEGPGARVDMRGVYLGNDSQHIDNHTRVDHIARDTVSREDYRGILRDRSRGVFNGKVYVHKGADGTDAAQSNPNLLLSDHAEIDTKPELEIYADDVKCAHGATVGQIDETSLFYLRSRGIDESTALQLLTYAFCREVLTGIENDALRIAAEQLVADQIPDFSALELIA